MNMNAITKSAIIRAVTMSGTTTIVDAEATLATIRQMTSKMPQISYSEEVSARNEGKNGKRYSVRNIQTVDTGLLAPVFDLREHLDGDKDKKYEVTLTLENNDVQALTLHKFPGL